MNKSFRYEVTADGKVKIFRGVQGPLTVTREMITRMLDKDIDDGMRAKYTGALQALEDAERKKAEGAALAGQDR